MGRRTMAKSGLGKADRFYKNPILRDQEWERATQAPWWLMALAITILGVAFFVGVYSGGLHSRVGWAIGVVTIVIYMGLGWQRRRRAREQLREIHGQGQELPDRTSGAV